MNDKWISVKDELPNNDSRVLILDENIIEFGYLVGKKWFGIGYGYDGDSDYAYNVTHWQPLPEPPKE